MTILFHPLVPVHREAAVQLYERSFPISERRDTNVWLAMANEQNGVFDFREIVTNDRQFLGFITLWHLDGFDYVEHFAIQSNIRGSGIGSKTLGLLVGESVKTKLPLLLEVEPQATSDVAKRRIEFYTRNGFSTIDKPYIQPPYRPNEEAFPLTLMTTDNRFGQTHFEQIVTNIHHHVYSYFG